MNAKHLNASHRSLFLNGGRLDILMWGYAEMGRQMDAAKEEREYTGGQRTSLDLIKECPCGCGLKNDICEERREAVKAENDEIPF